MSYSARLSKKYHKAKKIKIGKLDINSFEAAN